MSQKSVTLVRGLRRNEIIAALLGRTLPQRPKSEFQWHQRYNYS
jgi:hypothetical protein